MGSTTLVNGYHSALVRNNDVSKKWMVQKFGGTSIGKFADRIAEDTVRYSHTLWLPQKQIHRANYRYVPDPISEAIVSP